MTKVLSRRKTILLTLSVILLTLGFILLSGPAKIPNEFNEAIFSFRRITLAPIIILSAYGLMVFTIFSKK